MTPALVVATSTFGLVPLLLRGELPPSMKPAELVFDVTLRMLALTLGFGLIVFVLLTELTDESWDNASIASAAVLGAWTMLALAAQYLLTSRHRLWVAFGGPVASRRQPEPQTPGITNWVFAVSLVPTALLGFALISGALDGRAPGMQPAVDDMLLGAVVAAGFLAVIVFGTVGLYAKLGGASSTDRATARVVDGRPGTWRALEIHAPASPGIEPLNVFVWREAGRNFWTIRDAGRLIRFRETCAASAERPCFGLHARRMTLMPAAGTSRRPWKSFGMRVWDPRDHSLMRRIGAHHGGPFDWSVFDGFPCDARGLLVPIDRSMLSDAGLKARRRR